MDIFRTDFYKSLFVCLIENYTFWFEDLKMAKAKAKNGSLDCSFFQFNLKYFLQMNCTHNARCTAFVWRCVMRKYVVRILLQMYRPYIMQNRLKGFLLRSSSKISKPAKNVYSFDFPEWGQITSLFLYLPAYWAPCTWRHPPDLILT